MSRIEANTNKTEFKLYAGYDKKNTKIGQIIVNTFFNKKIVDNKENPIFEVNYLTVLNVTNKVEHHIDYNDDEENPFHYDHEIQYITVRKSSALEVEKFKSRKQHTIKKSLKAVKYVAFDLFNENQISKIMNANEAEIYLSECE